AGAGAVVVSVRASRRRCLPRGARGAVRGRRGRSARRGLAPPPRPGAPRAALPFEPVNARLSTRSRHPRVQVSPLGSNQRGNIGGSPGGTGARLEGRRL